METSQPTQKKPNWKIISIIVGGAVLLLILLCIVFYSIGTKSPTYIQTAIAETQSIWTPISTQTAYPTYTELPPVIVTKIVTKFVTPAFTPTPLNTPTITFTPLPPTSTPDKSLTAAAQLQAMLTADKEDGFYLVNVDIAPGVWRSNGTGTSCYWATTTKTGDILDNHFGMSGGTAYISPSAFQVEFSDCGIWVFVSGP